MAKKKEYVLVEYGNGPHRKPTTRILVLWSYTDYRMSWGGVNLE